MMLEEPTWKIDENEFLVNTDIQIQASTLEHEIINANTYHSNSISFAFVPGSNILDIFSK